MTYIVKRREYLFEKCRISKGVTTNLALFNQNISVLLLAKSNHQQATTRI